MRPPQRGWWLAAMLWGLGACQPNTDASHRPAAESAFAHMPYNSRTQVPPPRIFLVAGGDDIANFAAEVLEQRTLWRRAGIPESDIACYYSKPTAEAWRTDRAQYQKLAPALASCRRASPSQLFADLHNAAVAGGEYVYIFVTAHGLQSQLSADAKVSPQVRDSLGPAAIGLDAGPNPPLGRPRAIAVKLAEGTPPRDLMFTPRTLAAALRRFDASTKKIVVLQACFSGGFIDHHARKSGGTSVGADALKAIENLTVLTATAAERPSFGCDAGLERTYFGGAINKALERAVSWGARPDAVDWAQVFERASFAIETMEHIDGHRPSTPGFFDSGVPKGVESESAAEPTTPQPPPDHSRVK